MPANIESGVFGGGMAAWHREGNVVLEDVLTAKEAIEAADLDWPVWAAPVYAHIGAELVGPDGLDQLEVPGVKAIGRTYKGQPQMLAGVGKGYTVVQNREAFAMLDNVVQDGSAKYHTAGSLARGRKVWILARMQHVLEVKGMTEELHELFLLGSNNHDGTGSLRYDITPVRVVCENTHNLALRGALRTWSTRHTTNVHKRAKEARDALGLVTKYEARLQATIEAMLRQKLDRAEYGRFLRQLVPTEVGTDDGGRAAKNRDELRQAIATVYDAAPDIENIRGTAWGALQSVTYWSDHLRPARDGKVMTAGERRFFRVMHEPTFKNRALRILAPELAAKPGENLALLRQQ